MGAAVDINSVRLVGQSSPHVAGCGLDQPSTDSPRSTYALEVRGWVATTSVPVRALRVLSVGERGAPREPLAHVPVDIPRPDLDSRYGDDRRGSSGGFVVEIGALRLPPRFRLELRLVLEDRQAVRLAEIEGTRRPIPARAENGQPSLRPAVIVTTGRAGSTWLSHLLNQHPALVAYRPFKREPRIAAYWLEAALALSEPASYKQSLQPNFGRGAEWWLGNWPEASRNALNDETAADVFGRETPEALIDFARARVEAFYRAVAREQGKPAPRFFVEKSPGLRPRAMELMAEVYPGLRDILLLRDPRDVLCSILAYKKKNPQAILVRKDPGLDAEFLERLATSYRAALAYMEMAGDRASLVRYEDLVRDPARALSAILAHLGLERDGGTIAHMVESRMAGMEVHQTAPSVDESVGRWRRDLSAADQARANDAFKEALAGLDYE